MNNAFLEELLDANGFPLGTQSLIIEMMARWKIRLSYGPKKEVGEVRLENGIIQGDAFSPLLFVLMIDPLIKIIKRMVGDGADSLLHGRPESICHVDGDSADCPRDGEEYSASVGIVFNHKKSANQLNVETLLPESLQDIPRLDEVTYK